MTTHKLLRFLFIAFALLLFREGNSQSILREGTFYKFAVTADGAYKIDYNLLKSAGIVPEDIDPRHIRIYGNEGGMLPQENAIERPEDLVERSIKVVGEEDGKFDAGDYILLYAQGPDRISFDTKSGMHRYEKNLYSDKNYFFVVVDDENGKRVLDSDQITGSYPTINQYNDFIYHGLEQHNALGQLSYNGSGREWYGERFGATNELGLRFDVPGIVAQSPVVFVSDILGQTYNPASLEVTINDTKVIEQHITTITATTYGIKGHDRRDTLRLNEQTISAASNNAFSVRYNFKKAEGYSQAYLDYFLIAFKRALALYGEQTTFTSPESTDNAVSNFQVASAKEDIQVWDISNFYTPVNQRLSFSSNVASFNSPTAEIKTFVAFTSNVPAPEFIEVVSNQDLHSTATPNLLIVTHPDFEVEAERLANHRRNFSNWSVEVVTPAEIYNEFSSGRQDVTAIRDFVRHLYLKNPAQLKALLLFGKSSYDYKDRLTKNSNFVPTYESRNSINPLHTYSSDDYFCFLEDAEGEWRESTPQYHSLDIGVGRLPVTTTEQAKNVVDKIIRYETDKDAFGYWRKEIAFVADDGSNSDGFTEKHQEQANDLAQQVDESAFGYDTKKLFMGTYKKQVLPGGEAVPEMKNDVINRFKKGAVIINFTGHGNERKWTDEDILSDTDVNNLDNQVLPFLVTATCEFGRHDNPAIASTAELLVTKQKSGAIGLVTTSRPVNASSNFELNTAFYEGLLQKENNSYPTLGEVFRRTKNNSASGVGNRNFSLLADPSLVIKLPPNNINITSVRTANGSDTLSALSRVTVKGRIEDSEGNKLEDFNGVAEVLLFDKQKPFVTTGRNPIPFEFKNWHTKLFRGKASVRNGEFETEFVIPKNISYAIQEGKLSMYAADVNHHVDANGQSTSFKIGGTEANVPSDATPPVVRTFIGDTTFVNGGITQPDTWLLATLADENGINISDYGVGNGLIATLDEGTQTFNLNEYYVADLDNYRKGFLRFPLNGLAPGKHTITLKASDVYNNSTSATIEFFVTDGNALQIEEFGNYPNPFSEKTTLFFSHNRSGDDLHAELTVYSSTGLVIASTELPVMSSEYRVDLLELNNPSKGEKKLPAGIYFARLRVRSLTNGSENEHIAKLIVMN